MSLLRSDPILVLGAPRSGTTYLQRILDAHPEVALSNEVRLFEWLHRAIAQVEDERALLAERDDFIAHLRTELPQLIRRYYAARTPGARWWGDKNPHYAESEATLRTIAALFPKTRYVHIVRDPRAVIASLLKKRHPDGERWAQPEYAHALLRAHLETAQGLGNERGADGFHELRYEDLVADDEAVARQLFEWLGIPFAEEVATFCRAQATQRTPFSGPTTDLRVAGDRDAVLASWVAALPTSAAESLRLLAPFLLRFGYEDEASLEELERTLVAGPGGGGDSGQSAG